MPLINISSKNSVSLDQECRLISVTTERDELHRLKKQENREFRFCAEIPVQSSEFFNAGQNDIKASKALVLNTEDYSGERVVEYKGVKYAVYRTYPRSDGMTELYLEDRSGV